VSCRHTFQRGRDLQWWYKLCSDFLLLQEVKAIFFQGFYTNVLLCLFHSVRNFLSYSTARVWKNGQRENKGGPQGKMQWHRPHMHWLRRLEKLFSQVYKSYEKNLLWCIEKRCLNVKIA
jgi:hypothetical protein